MNGKSTYKLSCPIPLNNHKKILLAHGGGGKLTAQLIEKMFYTGLGNDLLEQGHDGALLPGIEGKIAFTTDSFVVDPVFFPGGDIGDLAVNGTINDLLCCGSVPLYISLAMILEEGFLMEDLWKIVLSIGKAARTTGVKIVTGDTKVVEKGKGDGIYINTTGIGRILPEVNISPRRCSAGDAVLINGNIGDHGIAIMSARKGLKLETDVKSDTCSLRLMMMDLFHLKAEIHVLRDPTRGGLASSLNEIAQASNTGITLSESSLPINDGVQGACEIMGYDPLYIANEGKILVILPEELAPKALSIMKAHNEGTESRMIGRVTSDHPGILQLETVIGTTRIVDMISGEQLPRIC